MGSLNDQPPTSKTPSIYDEKYMYAHGHGESLISFLPSLIYLFKCISLKSSITRAIHSCHFRSQTLEYLLGLRALWWDCEVVKCPTVNKILLFWTLCVTAFVFHRTQNDEVLEMHLFYPAICIFKSPWQFSPTAHQQWLSSHEQLYPNSRPEEV